MDYILIGGMALLVAAGSFLQSLIGIGFVLLVAPFLVMYDPNFVPVPMLLGGLLIPVLMMGRDHKSIDFKGIKSAIVGRIVGSLLAVWLITIISQSTFMIVFGIIVIIAVLLSLLNVDLRPTPASAGMAGFFSGLMGTLTGLGGPPMALLYQNEKGAVIRSTLSGFFIFGAVLSIIFLGLAGKITLHEIKLFFYMVPGILLGFYLSKYAIGFIDKGYIRRAMLAVSFLAAVVVIIKAVNL